MLTHSATDHEQCFQKFADELAKRQQQYKFSVPQYGDPELGLSIVMTHVGDVTYRLLEDCIRALGYEPIAECGVVRSVKFVSLAERKAFQAKFNQCYLQQT